MANQAKRIYIRKVTSGCGLESLVDVTAYIFLVVGLLVSLLPLLSVSLSGLLTCILSSFVTFVVWLLFRCLAEIIRLLKHQNSIPYAGRITKVDEFPLFRCEKCGLLLHSPYYCDGCGSKIVADAQTPSVDTDPAV